MNSRGFTLVELLVAVFITAIVTAMGYGALSQAASNRERLADRAARLTELQRGVRQLEQDIEATVPRPVREPLGNGALAAFIGTAGSNALTSGGFASGAATTNLSQQSQVMLSLTRAGWANPLGLGRTELQRVNYLLDGDKLIRNYVPVLDAAGELPTTRREVLGGVESVSFRYMDAGRAWVDKWSSNTTGNARLSGTLRDLPVAVEITLQLKDYGRIVRIVELAG